VVLRCELASIQSMSSQRAVEGSSSCTWPSSIFTPWAVCVADCFVEQQSLSRLKMEKCLGHFDSSKLLGLIGRNVTPANVVYPNVAQRHSKVLASQSGLYLMFQPQE
jgi:hypothetical protein